MTRSPSPLPRLRARLLLTAATFATVLTAGAWYWHAHEGQWKDIATVSASASAAFISVASFLWLSATNTRQEARLDAADERATTGWNIAAHSPDDSWWYTEDGYYVLRNEGTLAAHGVVLIGDGAASRDTGFLHPVGLIPVNSNAEPRNIATPGGPSTKSVTLNPGDTAAFIARPGPDRRIGIEWRADGESERRSVRTVLPPIPPRISAQAAAESSERRWRDQRDTLIKLGDAHHQWAMSPEDRRLRLRVQMLVTALPPHFVRRIGHEVDIPRLPIAEIASHVDAALTDTELADIELNFNIHQLEFRLRPSMRATGTEEPTFEYAVQGFMDRQGRRENCTPLTREEEIGLLRNRYDALESARGDGEIWEDLDRFES